jgi:hypothetical protein
VPCRGDRGLQNKIIINMQLKILLKCGKIQIFSNDCYKSREEVNSKQVTSKLNFGDACMTMQFRIQFSLFLCKNLKIEICCFVWV